MKTYATFLRSARNFEEFSKNPKITKDTNLSYIEALTACNEFNKNRTQDQIDLGTKMEFEKE